MYQQLYEHFGSIFLPKQCGFQESHSAQHSLVDMLEKFKELKEKREEEIFFRRFWLYRPKLINN